MPIDLRRNLVQEKQGSIHSKKLWRVLLPQKTSFSWSSTNTRHGSNTHPRTLDTHSTHHAHRDIRFKMQSSGRALFPQESLTRAANHLPISPGARTSEDPTIAAEKKGCKIAELRYLAGLAEHLFAPFADWQECTSCAPMRSSWRPLRWRLCGVETVGELSAWGG